MPSEATLIYLYSTAFPAGRATVTNHNGFEEVYLDAERAMALPGAQLPSAGMFPTILIVWPAFVVTTSLKVTATVVGAAQALVPIAVGVAIGVLIVLLACN